MRPALYALLFAGLAGPALADARPTGRPTRGFATVCLDTLGTPRPVQCRTGNASRIATDPDICFCGPALQEVDAPWCAPGETPAPDSLSANRARKAAADARGSLVGQSFGGRSFCVERGRTG